MKTFKSKLKEMSEVYFSSGVVKNIKITRSQDANDIIRRVFPTSISDRESMLSLYLNNSNRTLGYGICSVGGYTGTLIDLRILLKEALLASATGIILCHNHPSGNLKPSQADLSITNKVKKAAELIDVKLLDHLILSEDEFFSFADDGKL